MEGGSSEVQVVVVGYGFAGRRFHAPLVAATTGMHLYGIVARSPDTQQDARKEHPSAKVFDSFEAALADAAVELVVLATPTAHHPQMAIAALTAGKHVVTDKPMALSLADCDAMIKAAKEHDRLLSVFHNRRWDGDFLAVRKLVREGALGPVRWVELAYQVYAKSSRQWKAAPPEEGGGRYWDLGPHMVDQLLLLYADRTVTSVYARIHFDNAPASPTDTHALLIVGFDDGSTGVCDFTSATTIQKPRYLVVGRDATFAKHGTDPQEQALVKSGRVSDHGAEAAIVEDSAQWGRLKRGATGEEVVVPSEPGRWKSYYEDVRRRLATTAGTAAADNQEDLGVTVDQVRRQIAVLEAGIRSARTGAVVSLTI